MTVDVIVDRSLGGELIDITEDVLTYAQAHKLRWWQCGYCARGRVMSAGGSAEEERSECLDHEAHCEYRGADGDA